MTTRGEGAVQEFEIRLLEERCGGTNGIRRVGDDDIVCRGVVCEEFKPVTDEDGYSGIVKKGRHVREELFGNADDGLNIDMDRCVIDLFVYRSDGVDQNMNFQM